MGFSSYQEITEAVSVNLTGQVRLFQKTLGTIATAGYWYSPWTMAGSPGAGSYGTALQPRAVDGDTAGAFRFSNPGAGTLHILTGATMCTDVLGSIYMHDRLLDISGLDATSAALQSMSGGDVLSRYTTGAGVQMILVCTTTLGGTSTSITITYTNQAGTASRTATASVVASTPANRIATNELFIQLQAGDTGVRSVQSVQFGAGNSAGVCCLVLVYPYFALPNGAANTWVERDLVTQLPRLPQVVDDAAIGFMIRAGAVLTNDRLDGELFAASN